MSASSIARQNRRLKQKQLPALNIHSKSSLLLSPTTLKTESTNSELYDVSTSVVSTLQDDTVQQDPSINISSLQSSALCNFINSDVSSQTIGKVFVEDKRGFKVFNINNMQLSNHEALKAESLKKETAIRIAYKSAKMFHNFSRFCEGLLGGTALIHLLLLIHLAAVELPQTEVLSLFRFLSQPVNNIFNFLCTICCISSFDRYDIGNIMNIVKQAKKFQFSILIILLYPICLLMSLSTQNVDERIWLLASNATEWETEDIANELFYWKTLSLVKCVGAVIAWTLLCFDPNQNVLLNYFKLFVNNISQY